MSLTLNRSLAIFAALSALTLATQAGAVDLRVKCETRADRSRASVDGSNLAAGNYSAMLSSGANSAQSGLKPAVAGQAEFDFDSNKRDIRRGATPIAKDFIVNGMATGSLLDEAGNVLATKTVNCRRR